MKAHQSILRLFSYLLLMFLLLSLQACGGGSSSPPPVADQDASGLYTKNGNGTATFNKVIEQLIDVKGMVYGALPNQKFIFFDTLKNVLYDGVIKTIKGTAITGTADVYKNGDIVVSAVTVTGTVNTSASIDLTLAASGNNFGGGSIKGLFSALYNQAATNKRIFADGLAGNLSWGGDGFTAMSTSGKVTIDGFRVKADDFYSLNSVKNIPVGQCLHRGTIVAYAKKNIFTLQEDILITSNAECKKFVSTTPQYTGFASVVNNGSFTDNTMWYAVTNGTNSTFGILIQP